MDVFDRNNLDEVNREIYHGFTGAVNDDSAQSYGKDIGVQTVILGSLTKSGENVYSLRVQAIVVETKRIQAARTIDVKEDSRILSLLDISFTRSQITSAGFKNILFGWGSFGMKDPIGGVSVLIPQIGCIFVGALGVVYTTFELDESLSWEERQKWGKVGNGMFIGGLVGLGVTWTWGFIRPHMYARSVEARKLANVIDNLHIGLIPTNDGLSKVSFSMSYKF